MAVINIMIGISILDKVLKEAAEMNSKDENKHIMLTPTNKNLKNCPFGSFGRKVDFEIRFFATTKTILKQLNQNKICVPRRPISVNSSTNN